MVLSSSFWARVSFAVFWFPACPVRTEHVRVACHSASHSCTVLSVRSTIFRDDFDTDSFGGVQNRFGLHPDEHVTSGTFLPPDQDVGFLPGDLNLHVPITSETAQEIHEKHSFVSCRPYVLELTHWPETPQPWLISQNHALFIN